MSVGIECPVCEAIFAVKQVSLKTGIRCPECKRKYRYSEEILTKKNPTDKAKEPAEKTTGKENNTPEPSPPESKQSSAKSKLAADNTSAVVSKATDDKRARSRKDSKWKTAPTEPPRLATPKPVLNSDPKQTSGANSVPLDQFSADGESSQLPGNFVNESQSEDVESILARKKQKARRQTRNTILAIVTLSIATAILGVVLYRQINSPRDLLARDSSFAETNQPQTKTAPQNSPLSDPQTIKPSDWQGAEPEEPDEDDQPVELPRVLADDLPERNFEYLQKKELRSVWQRIRHRLISLAVRTDTGVKQSVGTIVDSRGWALTSNQLVGKWPDVTATASARNIDAYYADVDARKKGDDSLASQILLTDVSKGIASVQPKRDQTLLALNTRFVVALDKFEFAPRKNIVAGMYLVQAAPPSPTNPYGFEEVKVHGRQESEELETEAINKTKALGIDDPLTTWVVTSKKANPHLGTPVFTRTGQMVGTYAFSTKQFAYFVLTDQASNLIGQAAKSGAEKGTLQHAEAITELLSPSHPMARSSELLNRAGVACEAFGWFAADDDQYKQLQKFSRRFSTVAKYIQDNQDDASDSVSLSILSDQQKRWQRSLSKGIRDSFKLAPKKITKLNAIAIDKLTAPRPNTANTYIPFVAEIYSRGRDENNEDAILLTLNEDQSVIKVPFSSRIRGMRPGSLWLCFYKRPSQLKRLFITLNSGIDAPLYDGGTILTVLGPIEKR